MKTLEYYSTKYSAFDLYVCYKDDNDFWSQLPFSHFKELYGNREDINKIAVNRCQKITKNEKNYYKLYLEFIGY